MGRALYDAFAESRAVFQEVDDALGQKLSRVIFEGPEEDLRRTENTQPALMAVSLAALRALETLGQRPLSALASWVAGHSLGEYAALCAAGSLSLADTARLLRLRGQAMQKAVPEGVGAMAALLGVDWEAAQAIAAEAAQGEVCATANDNAPGQVVISGHVGAVDRAIALAAEKGFRRSVKLPVSAPFHSPLMAPAADVMREALGGVAFRAPAVPLVANVTAEPTQDVEAIRDQLVRQVTGSVRWRESVLRLRALGAERLVECGAGTVLTGLAKRIDKELPAVALQTPGDIEAFLKTLP